MQSTALAAECAAVFPDAVQNNNNSGTITFGNEAQIFNSDDTILESHNSIVGGYGVPTCDTNDCTHSGNSAQAITYNDIPNSNNDINIPYQESLTLEPGNYNNIILATRSELVLKPGDYKLSGYLKLHFENTIRILGTGVVRFFVNGNERVSGNVKKSVVISNESLVNVSGSAAQFLLYGKENIDINYKATFNGFVYSKKDVIIDNEVVLNGAISAKNVELMYKSKTSFISEEPDFGDFCEGSPPPPVFQCQDFWPGLVGGNYSPISLWGSINSDTVDMKDNITCTVDGNTISNCDRNDIINMQTRRLPNLPDKSELDSVIDASGTYTGSTVNNNAYAFYQNWVNQEGVILTYGELPNGTAVLYFDHGSNNVTIRKNSKLNLAGNPENLMLIFKGQDVVFEENVEINGLIYADVTQDVKFGKNNIINGAVAVVAGSKLHVEEYSQFIYDTSSLGKIEPHGFCEPIEPEGTLLALHRFEQTDFITQIDDTSGLDNHAEKLSYGLSSPDGKYCRGFESEGWNIDNSSSDGFRSNLEIDNDVGIQGTINFWFNSTVDWNQVGKDIYNGVEIGERTLFDATLEPSVFTLEITTDGRLRFAFEDPVNDVFIVEEQTAVSRTAGIWYYVSVSWDYNNNTFALYLDGELLTQQTQVTNGTMPDFTKIVFGDNSSTYTQSGNAVMPSPVSSRGNFDEVRIYSKVLSQSEIQADMNDDNGCSMIDHFEIDTLDGLGVTCQADKIIIKACANVDCTTLNTDDFDVDLYVNASPNRTITISDGSVETNYAYTTVGNAGLSINNQSYSCKDSLTTPCNVTFKDSGFVISNDEFNDGVPTQLSGKPSNIGFNARSLFIQAVKTDDNGACEGLFAANTDALVNLDYKCDAGNCTNDLILNNNGNNKLIKETVPTTHNLRFNADSKAEITLTYPDAARLILNAQATVEVIDEQGNREDLAIEGSSNAFAERPFGFKLDFSNDVNGANAISENFDGTPDSDGSPFKNAGESFTMRATAMQWLNGHDVDINGVPDNFTAFNSDVNLKVAKYFINETITVVNTNILLLPDPLTGGVNGSLSQTNNGFNGGNDSYSDNDYSYSEVGIIELHANLTGGQFLGDANYGNIEGQVTNVGRFIPAYFTQSVASPGNLIANHSMLTTDPSATCSTENWTYAGQTIDDGIVDLGSISYETIDIPSINITAYNINDDVTKNYTEVGFIKLLATGIDISLPVADDEKERATPPVINDKVKITGVMSYGDDPEPSGVSGVLTYTFNVSDHFIYEHNQYSKLSPFPAKIPFNIDEIEDSDGVKLYVGSDPNITATVKVLTEGVEVHFGRWLMENSFSPETSDLPMPMFVQHFNGTDFINNPQESCVTPQLVNKIETGAIGSGSLTLWDYRLVDLDTSDGLQTNHTNASVDGNDFVSGVYRDDGIDRALLFSRPGTGNQGSLDVEYEVPAWLKYDWNGNTTFNDNPSAIATFGIFRGNDRIIYQREIQR